MTMKKIAIGAAGVFILIIILGIIGKTSSPQEQKTATQVSIEPSATPTATPQAQPTKQDKSSSKNVSALDQMAVVFEGKPSKEEIKVKLDQAIKLYGLEITEDNYNRAGSALVSLRKASKAGVTEMEILDYMIRSYADNAKMSFADMAGLAATMLEKNIDQ